MVGVLPDDNHLHLMERAQVEGIENPFSRRIARAAPVLRLHRLREANEVILLKFRGQLFFPTLFYLYIHQHFVFSPAKLAI
jgi:hypothetical protein